MTEYLSHTFLEITDREEAFWRTLLTHSPLLTFFYHIVKSLLRSYTHLESGSDILAMAEPEREKKTLSCLNPILPSNP